MEGWFEGERAARQIEGPDRWGLQGGDGTVESVHVEINDHEKIDVKPCPKQPESLGVAAVVWEGSILLSALLASNPSLVRERRVAELGAGVTGVPGLVSARLSAAKVLVTDIAESVQALKANVARNGFDPEGPRVIASELDWDWEIGDERARDFEQSFDIVRSR